MDKCIEKFNHYTKKKKNNKLMNVNVWDLLKWSQSNKPTIYISSWVYWWVSLIERLKLVMHQFCTISFMISRTLTRIDSKTMRNTQFEFASTHKTPHLRKIQKFWYIFSASNIVMDSWMNVLCIFSRIS